MIKVVEKKKKKKKQNPCYLLEFSYINLHQQKVTGVLC